MQKYNHLFSQHPHVLHYRPLDGSKDGRAKVISKLHAAPGDTWDEPNPEDPLTVVDKVRKGVQKRKITLDIAFS